MKWLTTMNAQGVFLSLKFLSLLDHPLGSQTPSKTRSLMVKGRGERQIESRKLNPMFNSE